MGSFLLCHLLPAFSTPPFFHATVSKRTLTATTGQKDSNFRSTRWFAYGYAMAGKSLQQELGKKKPFESPEKEAMLNIARTSDQFQNRFGKLFREFGLTGSQHNVLRILRGEGRQMRCDEIRQRMIQVVPAMTGLLDRLEKDGFVTRTRCEKDGRVVHVAARHGCVDGECPRTHHPEFLP